VDGLQDDHRWAKVLETELSVLPIVMCVVPVETNIVIFHLQDSMPAKNFPLT